MVQAFLPFFTLSSTFIDKCVPAFIFALSLSPYLLSATLINTYGGKLKPPIRCHCWSEVMEHHRQWDSPTWIKELTYFSKNGMKKHLFVVWVSLWSSFYVSAHCYHPFALDNANLTFWHQLIWKCHLQDFNGFTPVIKASITLFFSAWHFRSKPQLAPSE